MQAAVQSPVYRRRRPERTVAYRALADHFERFVQVYEERFEPAFGYLRDVVKKAVYRYLDCGILESGAQRVPLRLVLLTLVDRLDDPGG